MDCRKYMAISFSKLFKTLTLLICLCSLIPLTACSFGLKKDFQTIEEIEPQKMTQTTVSTEQSDTHSTESESTTLPSHIEQDNSQLSYSNENKAYLALLEEIYSDPEVLYQYLAATPDIDWNSSYFGSGHVNSPEDYTVVGSGGIGSIRAWLDNSVEEWAKQVKVAMLDARTLLKQDVLDPGTPNNFLVLKLPTTYNDTQAIYAGGSLDIYYIVFAYDSLNDQVKAVFSDNNMIHECRDNYFFLHSSSIGLEMRFFLVQYDTNTSRMLKNSVIRLKDYTSYNNWKIEANTTGLEDLPANPEEYREIIPDYHILADLVSN